MSITNTFKKTRPKYGYKYTRRNGNTRLIFTAAVIGSALALALIIFTRTGLVQKQTLPPLNIMSAAHVPDKIAHTAQFTEYTVAAEPTPAPSAEPDRQIDFEALNERNSDIIGWISVDGTNIDYPLLKSKDNLDYLNKNVDREDDVYGAIFIDKDNKSSLTDPNTVIYGHNMKNGTMFAALHKFEDKDFFDENREIKIYMKSGGMKVYEIIAAYKRDDKSILYNRDFSDSDVFKSYVSSSFEKAANEGTVLKRDVSQGDRLVTLSTCVRGESDRRYVVIGLLK